MASDSASTNPTTWRKSPVLLAVLLVFLLALILFGNWRFGGKLSDWQTSDMMYIWMASDGLLKGLDIYDEGDWAALHAATGSDYESFVIWAYPYPAIFIFAPLALLPIDFSGALWLLVLELMYAFCIWWFLTKIPSARQLPYFTILTLALAISPPFVLILWFAQYGVAMLFFLVLAIALIEIDSPATDIMAGVYLSLLMFRPNPVILVVPAIGLWLLWRRRGWVILGGSLSTLLLVGAAWLVRPNWIGVWLSYMTTRDGRIESFGQYTATAFGVLSGFVPELIGTWRNLLLLAIALIVIGIGFWALTRAREGTLSGVVAVFCCVSLLATPYAQPYDHILLVFTVLWVLARAEGAPHRRRLAAWGFGLTLITVVPYALKLAIADPFLESRTEYLVPVLGMGYVIWALFALSPQLSSALHRKPVKHHIEST